MNPITNIEIYSKELVETITQVIFSFTKPSGNIGGYYLYTSLDGIVFTKTSSRIDATHQRDITISTYDIDKTYYIYDVPVAYVNTLISCYIVAVSTDLELSVPSEIISFYTYPNAVEDVVCTYNGYTSELSWNTTSTGELCNVYCDSPEQLSGVFLSSDATYLTHDDFNAGDFIWVIDPYKRSQWWGTVTEDGKFDLVTTKNLTISDTATTYSPLISSLSIYKRTTLTNAIAIGTSTGCTHTVTEYDRHVIYSVVSTNLIGEEGTPVSYPKYLVDVENTSPYIRSIQNSSTGIINNEYWSPIKACLIDKNYYDLTPFAIPYSKDTPYNLKGYLGVSNCNVDVYVNDTYYTTIQTKSLGEFELSYAFNYGLTYLQLQARDYKNIKFSRKSNKYAITTKYVYTVYSAWGQQLQIADEYADDIKLNISIINSKYSEFIDRFAPFIDIAKHADEDSDKFKAIALASFQAFEYVSYDEALRMLLDAYEENVANFDHYEIYSSNSLYQTLQSGWSFVPSSPDNLIRNNYYYHVSCKMNTGGETTPTELRCDMRWWPVGFTGLVALKWNEMPGADSYIIYRGSDSTSTGYMVETPLTYWVDDGSLIPNYAIQPKDMNFTGVESPENLHISNNVYVANLEMLLKKPNALAIVIYSTGDTSIPAYQIERLKTLLAKYVPPEIIYKLIVANDSSVTEYSGSTLL